MAWNDYANFSELDPSAAADYAQCIADEKAPASHSDEVGITVGSLALYLDILVKIFEQSAELDFVPGGVMARHPYGGRSATSVAKEYCKKITGSIPPVPDEVFLPVVSRAFEWLGAPARDILRLIDRYEIGFAASLHVRSNSYAWHINKALLPFRFDDCGTLTEPWREPLSGPQVDGATTRRSAGRPAGLAWWGPIEETRSLMQQLRTSCVISVQAGTGMRISEVAGLKADSTKPGGWPACVDVRPSLTGLNEIFYIVGRVYKNKEKWVETEWVAGSRPARSDYIPAPIRAVMILDQMYRPWRIRSGSTDLIISLGSTGLPRDPDTVSSISNNTLNNDQKLFMKDTDGIPESHRNWNLTTHQWRNSFAIYMVRTDGLLLPAVADHFHHMSMAVTEQGYLGNDAMLLGVIDDAAAREASRLLFETANGKTIIAGKMADIVEENRATIREMFDVAGSDDEKIDAVATILKEEEIRLWPSKWGDCFFRPETARCHFLKTGKFDLSARRPNFAQRQPSVCCVCSNLMASEVHSEFWLERHQSNLSCYRENKAIGDHVAEAVAADRVRVSAAVLRKLGWSAEKVISI